MNILQLEIEMRLSVGMSVFSRLATIVWCLVISTGIAYKSLIRADDLRQAIIQFNNEQLISLLKLGVDPNGLDDNGLPCLLLAWQTGNVCAFEILLEMGANPHLLISKDIEIVIDGRAISVERNRPILGEIVRDSEFRRGFVEVALRHIKQPNQVDENGQSIYHHLVNNPGRISSTLIALMVNSGVNPNGHDKNGLSPARVFARRLYNVEGELLATEFIVHVNTVFLSLGTDVLQASSDGTSLLDDLEVLQRMHPEKLADSLVDGIHEIAKLLGPFANNYKLRERHVISPLLQPMFAELPRLLDSKNLIIGNEVNIRGMAGMTPLWLAVHCNLGQEVEYLLRRGADTDLRLSDDLRKYAATTDEIYGIRGEDDGYFGAKGETVLMAACTNPYWRNQFIPPLIAATKDPNQRDQLGRNLLHRLLYHPLLIGQDDLIDLLVRAGVDLNAQTISGATPSHVAVALNPKAIPILVMAGADPGVRNMHQQTVEDLLSIAIRDGWPRQDDYRQTLAWLRSNRE